MNNVFISYSHDSQEHCDRVLALSNQLIADGLNCFLDQYESSPPEGWPKWMDKQLKNADQVILIITETYCRRVMDDENPGKGLGVKWESTLTYQYIYNDDSKNTRFIPVVFKSEDINHIPPILKGSTFYCLNDEKGYEDLYRRLTDQPLVKKPEPGKLKTLPTKETPSLFPTRECQNINVSISKLPVTSEHFLGRETELALLHHAWEDPHTHIITLVAMGGVGKTSLVNRWLNEMERQNYAGAINVYGWSFYSQGAEEGKQASADVFLEEALKWFGDPTPTEGDATARGRRLARLMQNQKSLVILDGLEPLQYPPGHPPGMDGLLKDQGLKAFLKELAGAGHPGLCVISTREKVTDLSNKTGYSVKEVLLENLSRDTGMQLLNTLGVRGSEQEIGRAVDEYSGHALALTLLGNYLNAANKGDIRKRDLIPALTLEEEKGGHAKRVMESYERWLGESAERDILYMMGLFDRPAPMGAINVLKEPPVIDGVTSTLQHLTRDQWQFALNRLRKLGLLSKHDSKAPGTETLDCHPLIREHFGMKLKRQNPDGWKAAHQRLYHYYKNLPGKEYPDTLEEMEPLFAAVAHGCAAGLHREAKTDVYWKRISRRNEFYCMKKLGAFGSDLAVLSNFFDTPWVQPAAGLAEHDKASVLSWAAFGLRAVGRLAEAIGPMRAGLDLAIQQKYWENASIDASNLSQLALTLGHIDGAVSYGRQSVRYADQSGNDFQKEVNRTTLADALHQAGNLEEAESLFRDAEAMQKERQPEYPFLYSVQGFRFCDLLLGQGQISAIIERAEFALTVAKENNWLLDISLDQLTLGRAWMARALEMQDAEDVAKADRYLNQAVDGLRKAGTQDHLPRGLLARAAFYRTQKKFSNAWDDLNEAHEIAELGSMKLHLADYHLEAGRLCFDEGKNDEAAGHFATAKEMIDQMGYHRRDGEIGL
ncbi:MAG: SEFIR domain-containing protein [Candidatus Omnitrophota bacterium]